MERITKASRSYQNCTQFTCTPFRTLKRTYEKMFVANNNNTNDIGSQVKKVFPNRKSSKTIKNKKN